MKKLERQIHSFVEGFFNFLLQKNICPHIDDGKYSGAIKSVELGQNFSLHFLEEWGGKKFYLTLYKGSKYYLELFYAACYLTTIRQFYGILTPHLD